MKRTIAFSVLMSGLLLETTIADSALVTLGWIPHQDAAVVGYNIYRADALDEQFHRINPSPVSVPSYPDGSVALGRSYLYSVTAVTGDGLESQLSSPVRANVGTEPELKIILTRKGPFVAGSPAAYDVRVTNVGFVSTDKSVKTFVILPPAFRYLGGGGDGWTCADDTSRVICEQKASLAAGETSAFEIDFWIDATGVRQNTISAGVGEDDGEPAHDELSLEEPVLFPLYFPYYRTTNETFSAMALSNQSLEPAELEFVAYDEEGIPIDLPENPSSFVLDPGTQLTEFGFEQFGLATLDQRAGWIQLLTDNPAVDGFFQFGDLQLNQLDGAMAIRELSHRLYVTRTLGGDDSLEGGFARSFLNLANPSKDPVVVDLRLIGPESRDGITSRAQTTREIPPRGVLFEALDDIFSESPIASQSYLDLQVTEGPGVVAFELIELGEGETVVGLNPTSPKSTRLYSAQFASGIGIRTSLKLVNTSDSVRDLQIRVVSDDGGELTDPLQLSLEPGGQFEQNVGVALGRLAGSEWVGSLDIEVDGPGIIGDVIFADPKSLSFAAAIPLQARTFTEAVFNHVANTDRFFTGLAMYNPGDAPADVVVEVHSRSGEVVGEASFSLDGWNRLSRTLEELIEASSGQQGGYVRIHSSQPLVAQQLFGEADLSSLSTIPPTVISAALD